jgi:hypothetical protein
MTQSSVVPEPRPKVKVTPKAASARPALEAYLRAQAPLLQASVQSHRKWEAASGAVFRQGGDPVKLATAARACGDELGTAFRIHKAAAEALTPPPVALRCHQYWLRWLALLALASDSLAHASLTGRDLAYLRDCRDYLSDARTAAAAFNRLRLMLHDVVRGVPAPGSKS